MCEDFKTCGGECCGWNVLDTGHVWSDAEGSLKRDLAVSRYPQKGN